MDQHCEDGPQSIEGGTEICFAFRVMRLSRLILPGLELEANKTNKVLKALGGFPGGSVVKNLPANIGDKFQNLVVFYGIYLLFKFKINSSLENSNMV